MITSLPIPEPHRTRIKDLLRLALHGGPEGRMQMGKQVAHGIYSDDPQTRELVDMVLSGEYDDDLELVRAEVKAEQENKP